MHLRYIFLIGTLLVFLLGYGQKEKPSPLMDTTIYDYDEIFSELDLLLDSLYSPRSFLVAQVSAGTGFFQHNSASGTSAETKQKLSFSPALGYYHKSGLGAGANASFLPGGNGSNPWQMSLSGSYDYLQKKSFITGLSLTHYFIKENLPFYTSPLQNEAYGYFTYRQSWLKPSLGASYGWGSRSAVEQRTEMTEKIQRGKPRNVSGDRDSIRNGNGSNGSGNSAGSGTTTTTVTSYEKVVDFNLQVSIRHDFYFLHLFTKSDYIRLTPQLVFTGGSQQFGFNSIINSTLTGRNIGKNAITNTQNVTLDNNLAFRPLSLTTQLRTEYVSGKFFVQPQLMLDYYFPAQGNNITTTFLVNTGVIF